METNKQFEDLHKATLQKLDDYLKTKEGKGVEDQEKIGAAKDKWQAAWNEFLETLVVLEKLEI